MAISTELFFSPHELPCHLTLALGQRPPPATSEEGIYEVRQGQMPPLRRHHVVSNFLVHLLGQGVLGDTVSHTGPPVAKSLELSLPVWLSPSSLLAQAHA